MRKRFKAKKRIKSNKFIYAILIIFLLMLFSIYISRIKLTNSNKKLLTNILNSSNHYSYNNLDNSNIISTISNYLKENLFNSPTNLLKSELNYKSNNQNDTTEVELIYKENDVPRVYIYNSHQGESYSYKYLEEHNIIPNVLMAAQMLEEKLENRNINTLVEQSDILKYMDENNLNHAGSYIASRYFLENAMKKYNSMDLYIDLHRDAANHSVTYTQINGKDCAKILFVIGLEYPTYQDNLSLVNDLNNRILEKYPTLTRGIMKKEGYGVDGVYNQDLGPNVILIEIGGHENNIDEVNNTLELIAEIIGEYLYEKE